MTIMKKVLPNLFTGLRIVLTVLLFIPDSFGLPFLATYLLCGLTDIFDGYFARLFHTDSKFGSVFDTIADTLFFSVALYFLIINVYNNIFALILIGVVVAVKIANIVLTFVKFREYAAYHSLANKVAGICFFFIPLAFYFFPIAGYVLGFVILASAFNEMCIIIKSRHYNANIFLFHDIYVKEIYIDKMTIDDAEALYQISNDASSRKYLSDYQINSKKKALELIQNEDDEFDYYAVKFVSNDKVIGFLIARDIEKCCAISVHINERYQGLGYGTHILEEFVKSQKSNSKNPKIVCICNEQNEYAIKMLENTGFTLHDKQLENEDLESGKTLIYIK